MALVKQSGNMYEFVTHMWGPIKGKCKHDCSYCYMKRFPLAEAHIDEKSLRNNLGENNFIFVGHTIDLFADDIPSEWIKRVLEHCLKYRKNKYLFQSKNPKRFLDFIIQDTSDKYFLPNTVFGTTIETNRMNYVISKAPSYEERAESLAFVKEAGYETMITIEPIFDFDLDELIKLIKISGPKWVNIGADSKNHDLPEPSKDKIKALIKAIKIETNVELKRNLNRILKDME